MTKVLTKYLELAPDDGWGCRAWLAEYQAGNEEEPPVMLEEIRMIEPPLGQTIDTAVQSKAKQTGASESSEHTA